MSTTTNTADQDALRVANRYAGLIEKATTLQARAQACLDAAAQYRSDARDNQESAENHRMSTRTIRDPNVAHQHAVAARDAEAEAAREVLAARYYEAQAEQYQAQAGPIPLGPGPAPAQTGLALAGSAAAVPVVFAEDREIDVGPGSVFPRGFSGPSVEWSEGSATGGRVLRFTDVDDGGQDAQVALSAQQIRTLRDELGGALTTGAAGGVAAGGAVVWRPGPDGRYQVRLAGEDGEQAVLSLTPGQMRAWHDQLGADLADEDAARATFPGLTGRLQDRVRGQQLDLDSPLTLPAGELSSEQVAASARALRFYRGGSFRAIAAHLRGGADPDETFLVNERPGERGRDERLAEHVEAIDQALAAAPLAEPVIVWRGVRELGEHIGADLDTDVVGTTWTERSFPSTSVEPGLASIFADDVLLRLHVPAGVGAIQLDSRPTDREHTREAEILLPRGLQMRVTGESEVPIGGGGTTFRDGQMHVAPPTPYRVLDVEVSPPMGSSGSAADTAAARAVLHEAVADVTAIAPRKRLTGGLSSDVHLVTLPDGRQVVHKRGNEDDPDLVRRQADAEVLAAVVAEAVGTRVAQVVRDPQDPNAVYMEYVDGPRPGRQAGIGISLELNEHPDAVRIGLLDALIGNADRQAIMSDGRPVGIDHEQAWVSGATGPWDLPSSPGQPSSAFVDEKTFLPGPLAREELEALEPRLRALRPQFEQAGRGAWHDYVMNAHSQLCDRAVTAARPPLTDTPLHGDLALDAPPLSLMQMTAAGDPRAEALWFRTGDNSLTNGYGQTGAGALNDYLRDPYASSDQQLHLAHVAGDISSAMADSVLTRPITVYRGLSVHGLIDAEPGQWLGRAFHDPAPASVTTDPAVAATHGTVTTVLVPPGVGAIRVEDRPEDDTAGKEIVLQAGLTYRVVDEQVDRDDRGRLLRHQLSLEVVPPRRQHLADPPAAGDEVAVFAPAIDRGRSGAGWVTGPDGQQGPWGPYGAAGVLVRHQGDDGQDRYLMVRAGAGADGAGRWQFPGGARDENETAHQAATRETHEELGVPYDDLARMTPHGQHVYERDGWSYTTVAATTPNRFEVRQADWETSDAAWLTRAEITDLNRTGRLIEPLSGQAIDTIIGLVAEDTPATAGPPPSAAAEPPTRPEGPLPRSSEPIRPPNGGWHVDQGLMHFNGAFGRLWNQLGDDRQLQVDGHALGNLIADLGEGITLHRHDTNQALAQLRRLREQLPDDRAGRLVDQAIARLDAPPRPVPPLPEQTPEPLRTLMAELNNINLVRRGGDDGFPMSSDGRHETDILADLAHRWANGEITRGKLESGVNGLTRLRHESMEGWTEIRDAVTRALATSREWKRP
jgi:8-oxo-dGTP pyrophosphatase MutT (NUDIX family)